MPSPVCRPMRRTGRASPGRRTRSFRRAGAGFLPLSQMFRDLETACLGGADLEPMLNRTQTALESALDEIAVLKDAA